MEEEMISTAAYMRVVTRKGMLPLCCLRSETDPIKSEQIYVDDNFLWKAGGFHYQKTAHLSLYVVPAVFHQVLMRAFSTGSAAQYP